MVVHHPLDTMQLEQVLDCLQLRRQVEVDRNRGVDDGGVHGDGDGVRGDAGERGYHLPWHQHEQPVDADCVPLPAGI